MVVTAFTVCAGCFGIAAWLLIVDRIEPVVPIVPSKDRFVRIARENRNKAIVSLIRKKRKGQNVDALLQHWREFDAKMTRSGK